jgi:hypothetical protein
MEPLADVGLASNIVHFVDFSSKLLSQSKALSQVTSRREGIELLGNATEALSEMRLHISRRLSSDPRWSSLAQECEELAQELADLMTQLGMSPGKPSISKFRQDKLTRKCELLRDKVNLVLTALLMYVMP